MNFILTIKEIAVLHISERRNKNQLQNHGQNSWRMFLCWSVTFVFYESDFPRLTQKVGDL